MTGSWLPLLDALRTFDWNFYEKKNDPHESFFLKKSLKFIPNLLSELY